MAAELRSGPKLRALLLMMIVCVGWDASTRAHAAEALPTLAILPFEVNDTSGEVGPDRHPAMLSHATTTAATQIGDAGLFSIVPEGEVARAIAAVNPGTFLRRCNGCEHDIAARANARYVMTGWVNKVSTLVLTFNVEIKDVASGKTVYSRVLDFRGDNETAYTHAIKTMVRSLKQVMEARPGDFADAARAKTRIAVFDFELEDKSAGGGIIAEDTRDRQYLAEATQQAKRLLDASGRYAVVATESAKLDEEARKFGIRSCRGCEAAAARDLGADAAMVGVITRVNRTEHTLLIKIVNAQTGATISTSFTDLRMGANYAWPRSVKWLMDRRVLAGDLVR